MSRCWSEGSSQGRAAKDASLMVSVKRTSGVRRAHSHRQAQATASALSESPVIKPGTLHPHAPLVSLYLLSWGRQPHLLSSVSRLLKTPRSSRISKAVHKPSTSTKMLILAEEHPDKAMSEVGHRSQIIAAGHNFPMYMVCCSHVFSPACLWHTSTACIRTM